MALSAHRLLSHEIPWGGLCWAVLAAAWPLCPHRSFVLRAGLLFCESCPHPPPRPEVFPTASCCRRQGGCSQEGACRELLGLLFAHMPAAVTQHPGSCVLAHGQALRAGTHGAVCTHPRQQGLSCCGSSSASSQASGSFPAPACSAGRPAHTLPQTLKDPHMGGGTHLSDDSAGGLGNCAAWGPNSAHKDGNTVFIWI